jgi:hypothetical protein
VNFIPVTVLVAPYPERHSSRIDRFESDSITAPEIDQPIHERSQLIRRRPPAVPGR